MHLNKEARNLLSEGLLALFDNAGKEKNLVHDSKVQKAFGVKNRSLFLCRKRVKA